MRQVPGKKGKMKPDSSSEPKVILDENSFFILDKPSGWIVNDSQTTENKKTIQEWIFNNIESDISRNPNLRSGIVHRLDKDTSGCLLVAKNTDSLYFLQSLFKDKLVKKKYTALLHGNLTGKGIIKAPVGRLPWNRERFGVLVGGRESETQYNSLAVYKYGNELYSLVEFFPKTGRTHQIRIHSKYIGHPVVCDNFYAGRKTSRNDSKWCPRLFLHASSIEFSVPERKENPVSAYSPLPPELSKVISTLEKISSKQ